MPSPDDELYGLIPPEGLSSQQRREADARNQSAESLQRSEEIFHLLVDSVQDYAIFVLDPQGHIQTWNSGAERIKGYRAEEIIGRHFSVFYPREAVERGWPQHELRVAAETGRFEDEGWRIRKDGSQFWANVVISRLLDPAGQLIGFSKVTRNLTERKQAEEALRESEERFRLLVERVGDYAIFMLDPTGHVTSWNAGAEHIKGYRAEEILGKHFSCFYTPEDRERNWPQEVLRQAFEHGRYEEESWRVRKDGERFIADVVITAVYDHDGRLRGFAKVTRDVTERKRVEETLRRTRDELEQQSRQLRRLAVELSAAEQRERKRISVILHDHLQQILAATRFGIGQIRSRANLAVLGPAVEHVDHLLGEAIQATRNLTIELSPPVLYDRGLATALEWQARNVREQHGLIVHLDLDRDAEPSSPEVQAYLFQAVRELLFNVVKHAGTGEAWVALQRSDSMAEITVTDRGAGVTPEQRTALPGKSGSFGLFSIQQRIGLLGGQLRIDTAPGRGFRARLTVPRDESGEGTAAESDGTTEADLSAMIRVLIVDDHRIVREGIAGLLQMHKDIEVVGQAENGRAAVELARDLEPDAILMDVSMPIMDGVDATRSIVRELPAIRIIGLSMYDKQDMAEAMLAAGAVSYLPKGGPAAALLAAIRDESAMDPVSE